MADGRLNSVYEFIFKGEDKVSPVVSTIEGQIDSTVRRVKTRFRKELEALVGDASGALSQVSSLSGSVKDAFRELEATHSSEAVKKASKSVDDYADALDRELEALKKLKSHIADHQGGVDDIGVDTHYLDVAIEALEKESNDLASTLSTLYSEHFNSLVDAYKNAGDASERARIQQQLYNDILEVFGEDTEKAKEVYQSFIDSLSQGEGPVSKIGEKFKSFFASVSKWTKGPSVLGGLVGGLVGAVTSVGLSVAINAVTAALQKGIKALTKWVKSWGEVKRAANEGAGAAVAATMSEVQELDRLNGKLKTTDKGTKEYAKTKDELVSKFGKYYDQLGDEISRVGYLADGYDQLRNAILRANLEKQKGAAIEGLEKNYNEKLAKQAGKARNKIIGALGEERGGALYNRYMASVYTGAELSGADQLVLDQIGERGGVRKSAEKLRKKVEELNNKFSFVEDLSPDYSARAEEIQREQQEEQRQRDVIQRQKEYQYELAQLNVDAMAEGASKQRAQADLNHRKELDQLDQYKADYIQKASEMYEAAWRAANPLGVYNPDLFWSNQGSPIAGLPTLSGAQTAAENQTSARKQGQEDAYRRELADIAKQTSSRAYQYAEQIKQNNKAVARAVVDAEFENRALRIEAMKDSTAKELAQLKLGHDQEIEQLRRQREDTLKQLQENEKTEWLAGGENRQEYQFKTTITEDSEAFRAQREQFEEQEKLLNEAYARSTADLLLKYDSLAVQRADLEKKWAETIETTTDERIKQILEKERNLELAQFDEQAVEQFGTKSQKYKAMKARMDAEVDALVDDTQKKIAQAANDVELTEFLFGDPAAYNNLAQAKEAVTAIYDARIKQAQAEEDVVKEQQLQRELAQELLELQKQYSAAFALIYADAQKLTTNQLQKAVEATQAAIESAANSGNIQALTDLYARLREQMNVMGDRQRGWGFSGMASGNERVQDASFKRMQAEALSAIDADLFAEEIKRLMEDAINDEEQGWAAIMKGASEVQEMLLGIGETLQSFGDETDEWSKALFNVGSVISGLGGQVSNFVSLYENMDKDTGKFKDGGMAISSGISAALSIVQMLGNAIKENVAAEKEWNKTIAESEQRLRMLQLDALDYKKQNIFGVENPYKKAIDGATQYAAAMGKLTEMSSKLNEGQVQTGTKRVVNWANVGKGAAAGAVAGLAAGGGVFSWLTVGIGAAVGALAGLFSTKVEPIFESLQSKYGQLFNPDTYELNEALIADYDKLDDETKQIVDNWDEIVAKAKEAEEQMRENFSNLAGDIGTQLADSLVDAFKNGELDGAVDDFHKKMNATIEDIIQQMVFSNVFSGMFDELQKDMEASFRGPNADNNIVDDLIRFEEAYQQGLADYEEQMNDARKYLQSKGYDAWENEDERKAQTRTALGASQDSVDESNARLTTIQGHTYEINENVRKLVAAAGLSAATGAILPSFPAMEPVAARDYSEDLLRIREELVVLSKNDDRFMAAIAELQSVTEGIRASSQRTSENTDEANAVAARIRSNLETVVDRGVTMR